MLGHVTPGEVRLGYFRLRKDMSDYFRLVRQVKIGHFRPDCAFLGQVRHFYDTLGQLRPG